MKRRRRQDTQRYLPQDSGKTVSEARPCPVSSSFCSSTSHAVNARSDGLFENSRNWQKCSPEEGRGSGRSLATSLPVREADTSPCWEQEANVETTGHLPTAAPLSMKHETRLHFHSPREHLKSLNPAFVP